MSYSNVPDYRLEPPEDTRRKVCNCKICGEPVREGDDVYDIPGFGVCCTICIDESKHYDVEVEDYREEV